MGLAERRVQKEFQDEHYPKLLKSVQEAAKFDVEVDVNWDSLSIDEVSHLYIECWPKVYFAPLTEALQSIAADDMGAGALKDSLKKIVIRNESDNNNAGNWCQFEGGTLTLDHLPTTNIDQTSDRRDSVVRLLEENL